LCEALGKDGNCKKEILFRRDRLLTEGDVPWLTIAAEGSQRQQLKSTWDADLPRPEEYATACAKDWIAAIAIQGSGT
jgi:hypothetical protein